MKHTPGPWTFRSDPSDLKCKTCNQDIPNDPWNYLIEGKSSSLIAKIWVHVGNSYSDEANAKLIAAAPDMLAALNDIIGKYIDSADPITQLEVNQKLVENAINAIKKATE